MIGYGLVWLILGVYGVHRSWLVIQFRRHRRERAVPPPLPGSPPKVLVQLPIYNERYVAGRLIDAVADLDYPRDRLEIQALDDSDDDTPAIIGPKIETLRRRGVPIHYSRRPSRHGYKAGALAWGLAQSDAPLVAIFDADFVPRRDFLRRTVGFFADPRLGMVQTRWEHLNRDYSLLTRLQSILLDGHFVVEQTARQGAGCFFNFNGTAGIWRRRAIDEAGGWRHDTLTEDLDLSYRAQAAGWSFLYLPDVTTPSEVPADIRGFKTQQHRWTKGAVQTARKLLGRLWRAPVPLRCKIEATFHLTNNICYLLLIIMVLLLGPVCLARATGAWSGGVWFDLPLFLTATVSFFVYFFESQRELGRADWRALTRLPLAMSLGIGMAVNNSWAVLEGLCSWGGEFVRTPKYGLESKSDRRRHKHYARFRRSLIPWVEAALFAYCLVTTIGCALAGLWVVVPFLVLFTFGFGYVAAGAWLDQRLSRHSLLLPEPEV